MIFDSLPSCAKVRILAAKHSRLLYQFDILAAVELLVEVRKSYFSLTFPVLFEYYVLMSLVPYFRINIGSAVILQYFLYFLLW